MYERSRHAGYLGAAADDATPSRHPRTLTFRDELVMVFGLPGIVLPLNVPEAQDVTTDHRRHSSSVGIALARRIIADRNGTALVMSSEGRLDHLLDLPAIVEPGRERPILHDRVDDRAIADRMAEAHLHGCRGIDALPELGRNGQRAEFLLLRPRTLQRGAAEGMLQLQCASGAMQDDRVELPALLSWLLRSSTGKITADERRSQLSGSSRARASSRRRMDHSRPEPAAPR